MEEDQEEWNKLKLLKTKSTLHESMGIIKFYKQFHKQPCSLFCRCKTLYERMEGHQKDCNNLISFIEISTKINLCKIIKQQKHFHKQS